MFTLKVDWDAEPTRQLAKRDTLWTIAEQDEIQMVTLLPQVANRLDQQINAAKRDQAGGADCNRDSGIAEEVRSQLTAGALGDARAKAALLIDIEAVGHDMQVLHAPAMACRDFS